MNKCKKCSVEIPAHRIHLGYSECTDCSTVKKYVSHTIYPHKTGAWVQPVSEEQSKNLSRLDRRSVGGQRQAKGIIADQSWDRWLEQYWHNKYNPKPEPKKRKVVIDNTFIPYKEAVKTAYDAFNSRGYKYACEVTQSLYSDDKISLIQKSKIVNELCFMQSLTAKQRKIIANKA
tara:strand:- start:210 stop:734 length:525 start_codon:yes stop_codon:yes gene_type:complete